jgi:type VI secretion system protein ImpH
MAAEEREPADPLKLAEALLANASRADFFSLVPLLERLSPHATRIGGDGPPSKEALRFRHDPSMGFSTGDIASGALAYVRDDATDPLSSKHAVMRLTTTFLGLTGSVSPLPLYIPAEIAHNHDGENLQANFLDIFHHRLLSLFYRLWTRYQYAREFTSNADDVWSRRVLALAAPTSEDRAHAQRIPRHKLLRLAPLLVPRSRSARGLELALEEVLDLSPGQARVAQLVGGYTPIDEDQRMRLSKKTAVLGRGAVLGSMAYERGNRFCIRLGPMSASEYPHYIRRGERVELVREVVNLMVREPLDYDLELLLMDDALPGFLISARHGMTLGVTTRLRAAGGQQSVMVRNVGRQNSGRDTTRQARTEHEEPSHAR